MAPSVNEKKTNELKAHFNRELKSGITHSNASFFAKKFGAHIDSDSSAKFVIWHSAIEKAKHVEIEIFEIKGDLIYSKPEQHADAIYHKFAMSISGPFAIIVMDNLPAGNRDKFGAFYQFRLFNQDGSEKIIRDPMAWSMPYGINAPGELYNAKKVLSERKDLEYYTNLEKTLNKSDSIRIGPSTNMLEVHTGTATRHGSIQSLKNKYQQLATTIRNGNTLSADQKNLLGFDAVQLMPIDPVIEHPENHAFWNPIQTPTENRAEVTIRLKKPSVINWGYDIVIFGSAALNPSILSTGRPHELLELIETLHNFPDKPIKVILDVVYGHADNQGLDVLPEQFFAGPNMYGQNIDFKNPLVRAMILEMQHRKINWGFDGVRVDGAQDFKYYDAEKEKMVHDDEFLNQMSEVTQEVAGVSYKPWMIFEDGRPWPRDDWELASTYREITEQQKHPYQWAPMIFAYNTPYNYTYWVSKWWRIKELLNFGEKWISGYANHDTMRRGTQADPDTINVNHMLGNSLRMVMDKAYNNPSTSLLMNSFLPGVPMDFVQALGSTPWSFFRNTDTKYGLKVAAEEAHFTEWQITEIDYRNSHFFTRLKDLGFRTLPDLRRFAKTLLNLVKATDYEPTNIATLLNQINPPLAVTNWSIEKLNEYTTAWMEDLHEYCNADNHAEYIDGKRSEFNLQTRKFRLRNPWLNDNFNSDDFLTYLEPVDGTVIFYGYRKDEETGKELIFISNMEGQPKQINALDLKLPIKSPDEWSVALSTHSVRTKKINQPIKLSISQGLIFEKKQVASSQFLQTTR